MNLTLNTPDAKTFDYASKLLAQVDAVPEIQDDAMAGKAADLLKLLKTARKRLEDDRKGITGPIKASIREIEARYKPKVDALNDAARQVDQKLGRFLLEKKRAEEAARRKIEEEKAQARREAEEAARKAEEARQAAVAAGGEEEAGEAALEAERQADAAASQAALVETARAPVAGPARGSLGSTASVREVWDFEVEDPYSIPREFLTVDEKAVRKAISGKDGRRYIPGLRIFAKASVTSR